VDLRKSFCFVNYYYYYFDYFIFHIQKVVYFQKKNFIFVLGFLIVKEKNPYLKNLLLRYYMAIYLFESFFHVFTKWLNDSDLSVIFILVKSTIIFNFLKIFYCLVERVKIEFRLHLWIAFICLTYILAYFPSKNCLFILRILFSCYSDFLIQCIFETSWDGVKIIHVYRLYQIYLIKFFCQVCLLTLN